MRALLFFLCAVVVFAVAPSVRAQIAQPSAEKLSVELTPIAGYLAGGALNVESGELRVASGGTWGVLLDIPMYRFDGAQLEVSYVRLNSDMTWRGGPDGDQKLYDVSVEYWHAGVLQEFVTESPWRPFALISLGATGIKPSEAGVASEWWFSGIVAGGGKFMLSNHVGLRLEGRLYTTFINSTSSFLCGGRYGCFITVGSEVVFQAQANAGLIVAF